MRKLKTWPEPFQASLEGNKKFEWRLEDGEEFKIGEIICLEEFNPGIDCSGELAPNLRGYTGRRKTVQVTYIMRSPNFNIPKGYVILGVRDAV
jgi:hypothetical protein